MATTVTDMDNTKALIDRCKRLASNRETISFDAYGAKKALRLLNEMSDALTEVTTAISEQGEAAQPAAEGWRAMDKLPLDGKRVIGLCHNRHVQHFYANPELDRKIYAGWIPFPSPNGIASQEKGSGELSLIERLRRLEAYKTATGRIGPVEIAQEAASELEALRERLAEVEAELAKLRAGGSDVAR